MPNRWRHDNPAKRLRRFLAALGRSCSGVIISEYVGAAFVCALCMVWVYREYDFTLTESVHERVRALSTGGAPNAIDNRTEPPGAPGGRPCRGDQCDDDSCFAAGTTVLTAAGDRAIESVRPGELVWSRDQHTGEAGWKPVTAVFTRPHEPLLELELGADGASEILHVTHDHPFWREGVGWTSAGELDPDARVWSPSGSLTVQASASALAPATVYNLEVADYHTYFVGRSHAWVHNACDEDEDDDEDELPRKFGDKQTCPEKTRLRLEQQKDAIAAAVPPFQMLNRNGNPVTVRPSSTSKHDRVTCSSAKARREGLVELIDHRQKITNQCFGGVLDDSHRGEVGNLESGLATVDRLIASNCAPGHPMAEL